MGPFQAEMFAMTDWQFEKFCFGCSDPCSSHQAPQDRWLSYLKQTNLSKAARAMGNLMHAVRIFTGPGSESENHPRAGEGFPLSWLPGWTGSDGSWPRISESTRMSISNTRVALLVREEKQRHGVRWFLPGTAVFKVRDVQGQRVLVPRCPCPSCPCSCCRTCIHSVLTAGMGLCFWISHVWG